jgi:hypothetical protein
LLWNVVVVVLVFVVLVLVVVVLDESRRMTSLHKMW